MDSAAPAIRLLPALLLAVLLNAGPARADSTDELQIDGSLDVIELGDEAAHKENVEDMITDLTPQIDSGRLSEAQLVGALAPRCWVYYEKGLFDLAVADCNRVLASRPDHGMALALRASAYIRLGRFAAAVQDLDHAIADGGLAKKDLGLAYLRRAIAREAMGDGEKAAADVKQAVALDPRLMDTYRAVSAAMLGGDKSGGAVQSFDQAMALDPKSAPPISIAASPAWPPANSTAQLPTSTRRWRSIPTWRPPSGIAARPASTSVAIVRPSKTSTARSISIRMSRRS